MAPITDKDRQLVFWNLSNCMNHKNMCTEYLDEINHLLRTDWTRYPFERCYFANIDNKLEILRCIKSFKLRDASGVGLRDFPHHLVQPVVWAAFMAAPRTGLEVFLKAIRAGTYTYQDMEMMLRRMGDCLAEYPTKMKAKGSQVASALASLAPIWGVTDEETLRDEGYMQMLGDNRELWSFSLQDMQIYDPNHKVRRWAFEPASKSPPGQMLLRLHIFQDSRLDSLHLNPFSWQNNLAQDPREILQPGRRHTGPRPALELAALLSANGQRARDGHCVAYKVPDERQARLVAHLIELDFRFTLMAALIGTLQESPSPPNEPAEEGDTDEAEWVVISHPRIVPSIEGLYQGK